MFKEIEDAWTQDSVGYDELVKKQLSNKSDVRYWTKELKKVLGDRQLKVLDVGCGPGFLSILMMRLGHEVKAIDGSAGMVRCAAANFAAEGRKILVQEEDAVELPEEEEEVYDVIISRDVVWTLYDPLRAFVRWKEVLKPGGKVIVYDGDYRRDTRSFKITAWKCLSCFLTAVTERKLLGTASHSDDAGVFAALPMVSAKRPERDLELFREAGYKKIRITNDRYRNSPKRMEFWKYGYQGRKFRVMVWK